MFARINDMSDREPEFELFAGERCKVAIFSYGICDQALEYFSTQAKFDKPALSFANGDFEDLDFLKVHASWIYDLSMNYCEKMDWNVINRFKGLTSMKFSQLTNTKGLDPTSFPNLTWLDYYWGKDMESKIHNLKSLQSLNVSGYKARDISGIKQLGNLVDLKILHSRTLESIDEIALLKKLEFAQLIKNSKLGDLAPLGQCKSLKTLRLEDNNKAFGYESIARISGLQELELYAKVSTASWLTKLKKLKKLRLFCSIEDGDLRFIENMKSLEFFSHWDKRNFNLTDKESEAIMREKGFDPNVMETEQTRLRKFPEFPLPT